MTASKPTFFRLSTRLKAVVCLVTFGAAFALIGSATLPSVAQAAFGDGKKSAQAVPDPKDPLIAKVRFQPSIIEAGGTLDLIIDMEMVENYHAYLERFKLAIESPDDLKLAPFKITPVVRFMDVVSKTEKDGIEGRSTLRALMEVPSGFKAGSHVAKIKLTYQACTADHCLFPKSLLFDVPFTVSAATAGGPVLRESEAPVKPLISGRTKSEFEVALDKSVWSAFLLVFVVGFLTSLTPCVYPMIPITLAVLGARAKHHSHLKNFSLALVYVFGIALTYSLMGVGAAMTGGLFGAALSNIWVVTAIAILFVAMALSMFGLFEVQAPAFIRNRLGAARGSHGYGGALMTGLVAGIVASPCIGPVLVSVLTYIAQTQSKILGFSLLFTFAVGMGLPFIALGISSSWISKLPKAGTWMEGVKFFFGIVMLGMALYYVQPLYPTWLFQALLGFTLVLFASFFGAFEPTAGLSIAGRLRKGAMMAALASGAALCTVATLSRAGYQVLSPSSAQISLVATGASSAMKWQPYALDTLSAAAKQGRPVLIDFSAEWCGACKEMDRTTFVDANVVGESRRFTLLKVDGTEDTPELKKILDRYGVQGFPTYLFFDGQGQLHTELTLLGYEDASAFVKRLQAL